MQQFVKYWCRKLTTVWSTSFQNRKTKLNLGIFGDKIWTLWKYLDFMLTFHNQDKGSPNNKLDWFQLRQNPRKLYCFVCYIYRVSRNTVYTFVLLISRPPKHLKVPSWTFFNSPFCVDFKTIKFVIIWCNFDWDITKILKGSHWKN